MWGAPRAHGEWGGDGSVALHWIPHGPECPWHSPERPWHSPRHSNPPEHPKIPPLPWDLPSGRGIWTPRRSWRSFPGEETLGLLRALPAHSGGAEALLGTRTPCGPPQHAGDARSHQRAPEVPRARTRREKNLATIAENRNIFFSPPSETFLLTAALTSAPPRCHKCHLLTQECPNHPQLLSPTLRNPAGPLSVPPAGADPARVGNDALRHPELSPRLRHPRSAYLGREGCVGISRGPAGPGGCRGLGCEAELGWWLAECGCVCPKPLQHLCIRMCSSLSSLLACALPRSLPTTTPLPGDGELFFF